MHIYVKPRLPEFFVDTIHLNEPLFNYETSMPDGNQNKIFNGGQKRQNHIDKLLMNDKIMKEIVGTTDVLLLRLVNR